MLQHGTVATAGGWLINLSDYLRGLFMPRSPLLGDSIVLLSGRLHCQYEARGAFPTLKRWNSLTSTPGRLTNTLAHKCSHLAHILISVGKGKPHGREFMQSGKYGYGIRNNRSISLKPTFHDTGHTRSLRPFQTETPRRLLSTGKTSIISSNGM